MTFRVRMSTCLARRNKTAEFAMVSGERSEWDDVLENTGRIGESGFGRADSPLYYILDLLTAFRQPSRIVMDPLISTGLNISWKILCIAGRIFKLQFRVSTMQQVSAINISVWLFQGSLNYKVGEKFSEIWQACHYSHVRYFFSLYRRSGFLIVLIKLEINFLILNVLHYCNIIRIRI